MALTTFAAVLPSSIGSIVGDLLGAQWKPQARQQRQWWNQVARPMFETLVAAGAEPAQAAEIALRGTVRPGEVKRLVLQLAGSAHQIVERKEGTEVSATLGFMGAVSVSLGGSHSTQQTTNQASEATSRLEIECGPAADAEFTRLLLEALVRNPTGGLPTLPDLPEL